MSIAEVVWITGTSGMLGKTLLKSLKNRVLGISRRAGPGGVRCDLADASQVEALFKSDKPLFVINAAAYSDVDGCERDPKAAHDSNALAVKNLAAACAAAGVPWVHVSTDYVFDGKKRSPYLESDATGPVNIYGLTKLTGEFYARNSASSCAIVRTSWLFGAENPANFVNAMMERLKKEKEVAVLDDQTDCPTHVKDLSEALIRIGERLAASKTLSHGLFHVCNAGAATRHEMVLRMREWMEVKTVVKKADRSQIQNRIAVRPAYAAMSSKHFEEAFGMRLRPWQESLKEYVQGSAICAS